MKGLHIVAYILVIVGALNWGLVGVGGEGWNVVSLLGSLDRWVYILVGLSAVFLLVTHKKCCKACKAKSSNPAPSNSGSEM